MTRKRAILSLMFAGALVLAYAVFDWSTQRRFEERWDAVRVGISKAEVKRLLGGPDDVYLPDQPQSNSLVGNLFALWLFDSYRERWAYGQRSLADRAPILSVFGFGDDGEGLGGWFAPKDDDYVLYFSAEEKVARKVHPYRSPLQSLTQNQPPSPASQAQRH